MYCLSAICTMCLVPNNNLKSILSQDTDGTVVEEKLKVFLSELIHYQPNIPKYICPHCLLDLNYVYKFRLRCLENFTKFNKYVQKLQAHGPYTNLSVTLTDTKYDKEHCLFELKNPSNNEKTKNTTNSQGSSIDADVVVKQEDEPVFNNFQTPYQVFLEFHEEKHIIDENINKHNNILEETNLDGNSDSDLVESFKDNGSDDEYLPSNTSHSTASRRTASKAGKSDSTVPDEQHSFGGCESDLEPFEDNGSDDEYVPSNASSTASEASNSDLELTEIQSPGSSTLAVPKETYSSVTKYTSDYISTSDLRSNERSQKSYKCENSALITHKRSHASEKRFKCDVCDKAFSKNVFVERHTIVHTDIKANKKHSGAKSHLCDVCDKGFVQKVNLLTHKLIQSGKKPYKCDLCDYKCRLKSNLTCHKVNKHSDAKPHQCDVCDKGFVRKDHLLGHKLIHCGKKPYKCDLCDYECRQINNLSRHKLHKHSGGKPHQCDVCDKGFAQKVNLLTHKLIHSGKKPYKCDLCDYKCRCKSNLTVHKIKKHSDAKPHKCDVCDKGFKIKANLQSHKLIHSGKKPYQCDLCDYKCRRKDDLALHKFKHSGAKPHQCDVCDKGFVRKDHLIKHKLVHTGN